MRLWSRVKDLLKGKSLDKELHGVFGITSKDAIFRVIKDYPDRYEVSKGHFKDGRWVDVKIFPMWKESIQIISENAARSLMRQRQVPKSRRSGEN